MRPKLKSSSLADLEEFARQMNRNIKTRQERAEAPRERRYQAERDKLVAVLSKIFPAHITPMIEDPRTPAIPALKKSFSESVCIHTPAGQMAWALPFDREHLFAHLERSASDWDGHTASTRNARLDKLIAMPREELLPTAPAPRRRKLGKGKK